MKPLTSGVSVCQASTALVVCSMVMGELGTPGIPEWEGVGQDKLKWRVSERVGTGSRE